MGPFTKPPRQATLRTIDLDTKALPPTPMEDGYWDRKRYLDFEPKALRAATFESSFSLK